MQQELQFEQLLISSLPPDSGPWPLVLPMQPFLLACFAQQRRLRAQKRQAAAALEAFLKAGSTGSAAVAAGSEMEQLRQALAAAEEAEQACPGHTGEVCGPEKAGAAGTDGDRSAHCRAPLPLSLSHTSATRPAPRPAFVVARYIHDNRRQAVAYVAGFSAPTLRRHCAWVAQCKGAAPAAGLHAYKTTKAADDDVGASLPAPARPLLELLCLLQLSRAGRALPPADALQLSQQRAQELEAVLQPGGRVLIWDSSLPWALGSDLKCTGAADNPFWPIGKLDTRSLSAVHLLALLPGEWQQTDSQDGDLQAYLPHLKQGRYLLLDTQGYLQALPELRRRAAAGGSGGSSSEEEEEDSQVDAWTSSWAKRPRSRGGGSADDDPAGSRLVRRRRRSGGDTAAESSSDDEEDWYEAESDNGNSWDAAGGHNFGSFAAQEEALLRQQNGGRRPTLYVRHSKLRHLQKAGLLQRCLLQPAEQLGQVDEGDLPWLTLEQVGGVGLWSRDWASFAVDQRSTAQRSIAQHSTAQHSSACRDWHS